MPHRAPMRIVERVAAVDEHKVVLSDGTELDADLIVLAAGVRPESGLAKDAGLALDGRGAILVDEFYRPSDPAVYAIGDATVSTDAVTGAAMVVPLAGPANRAGRAVADHIFGNAQGRRRPVLGTAIVRVFDLVAATTGRNERALLAAGVAHHVVHLHPGHHAGYFPGAQSIHLKLIFAPDGTLLGAQATGTEGVDKRIDIIATAMLGGLKVDDLAELELAYAPPFGSAKDPVNLAGFIAQNVLSGDFHLWYATDLNQAISGEVLLIDTRSAGEYAAGHLPGSVNIAHTALRDRLDEVEEAAAGRAVWVYCASGFRSYLASRILAQTGHPDVRSLSGGLGTLRLAVPDLDLTRDVAPV